MIFRSLLLSLVLAGSLRAGETAPQVGLQSWTCRNMTFEQVVAFADQHHLKYLQLFPKHLNPTAPADESLRKKALLQQHGLVCYTFGVAKTSLDPAVNRRLFEFGRLMGVRMIVVAPNDPREWDNLEALVKEFDIKLAIHNEGPGTPYANPGTVRTILAARDPRIGVCLDAGHITEAGFDAAETFRSYHGRVFDIHLKDKKRVTHDGKTEVVDVMDGAGDANYAGLFAEVKREHWSGVMAIETDNVDFQRDPGPFVDQAIAFFHAHVR